jgi:hypothetical protein
LISATALGVDRPAQATVDSMRSFTTCGAAAEVVIRKPTTTSAADR